jgi:hypothetical protein
MADKEAKGRGNHGIAGEHHRVKTHCPQGHPYDEANTYRPPGAPRSRKCRECMREARRKADSMRRLKA